MTPAHLLYYGSKLIMGTLFPETEIKTATPIQKKEDVKEEKEDKPKPWMHEINYQQFKRGIVQPENSGQFNYGAKNPLSSASGAYQILYNEHKEELRDKYGIATRDEFLLSKDTQEAIMDARIKRYEKDAYDLYIEYKPQLKEKFIFTEEEIMALVHFAGRGGTRKYLGSIRDGKTPPPMPGLNLTQEQYLSEFNFGLQAYEDNNADE